MIRRHPYSYCGLQIVADDDDVTDRKIRVCDQSMMMMMMMLLIERSVNDDDDDVADRKIRV